MKLQNRIEELLSDLHAKPSPRPVPETVLEPIARLVEPSLDSVQFSASRYMRHPIYLTPEWEVMIIAWEMGQKTPIHDHRGVWGSMLVFSGGLIEEVFDTPGGKPDLVERGERASGSSCLTSPTLLHRLFPKKGRSISLHIYRPALREMGIWEAEGMSEIRASDYDVPADILGNVVAQ